MTRSDHKGDIPREHLPPLLVVGVGASADGQDALSAFFAAMPANAGMAFVLVQPGALAGHGLHVDMLREHIAIPVGEAQDSTRIAGNQVYVVPPGRTATIAGGVLQIRSLRGQARPIDTFFYSLAERSGSRAVGVLLSSAGGDGTLGLKAIGAASGVTLAQRGAGPTPVPQDVAAKSVVDHVLPPAEMAPMLVAYARYLDQVMTADQGELVSRQITESLGEVATVLLQETGHDFSDYRPRTLVRRLRRRMQVLQSSSVHDYLQRLRQGSGEARALFRDLLIGVTAFFRVPAAFEALTRQVLERLLEAHTGTLRIWVPGCATGEEAYSLAILLQEQIAGLEAPPRVQIFATDIDDHALDIARQGTYPEDIAGDISAERLARFFVERGNRYRVISEIRDICLFSRHDLISDPPFSRLDLISCRNVLIYLEPSLQQKIMPMFHFALRPGGYLFQGQSESTYSYEELFLTIDAAHHISRRRPQATRAAERPARFGSSAEQIAQLERELARTRAQLEYTVQELEASNEELKSSNEELQLMNEELHATNDEIEVSKEELQTTNAALIQANSRLESLLVSTHIATVSLDGQMRIQSFSPAAAEIYNLLPGDVGRPIDHITHRAVHMPPLPEPDDVERTTALIEHQIQMAGGRWYMRRVLPYRPIEGAQAGMVVTFVDITAFKRTEIALRESEQRFRVAFHNTPVNVYQCDRELRYVWQANAHPDWSPERILGHRPDDLLPTAQATPLMTTMQRVLDTGAGTRHELSLDTSRGRQTWDMAIESLRDDDGAITGLTLAVLEVTQRKQTEEALRDQETRLRLALDAGRMGAWEWNIQTNDLVWSMSVYDQLGVPINVDRPTAETFFDRVHPADLPALLEALTRAQQGTDEYEVEFRVERSDGALRWFLGKGAVFWDDSGVPLRMHGVNFDITERKEAEERLQRIFEQAVVGIALVAEDGRWLQANRRLCEILGYAWDELRRRTLRDLAHAADVAELRERFREMLTGQRETFSMEARHLRKDGTIGWAHLSASFLVPAATERIFVAVVEDITARKHYEQAIEEEARHKDQFLAMLGHELRNPLAAIRNAVELQRALDVEHSSLARARDVIERQSTHMARLIDDLLDVSRIARGKIQLAKVTLDLADLVATVVADHRGGIAKVGLTLSIEVPEMPIWVMGDPTRLAQVVGNLLDNAAKFTQPPGTITVRAAQQGDTAVIEVRDTGVGIEPAMLERIFEVFQQASSTQGHSPGGLGLGLSLVQGLLALHQGTVEAHSAGPGTGASFLVRLPASAPPAAHAPGRPRATAPGEAQRILVVDDNRDSANVLSDVLVLAGHHVAVAYDGAGALALADQHRPDTVICDIGLPGGMTGYDVARALRGHVLLASVRLIAMTGYGRHEDRVRAHEAGFDHHLTKPVTLEQLRQVLAR